MRKTPARRPCDERAGRPIIASNGVHFLQIRSVGSHSTSGREKEGKDGVPNRVGVVSDLFNVFIEFLILSEIAWRLHIFYFLGIHYDVLKCKWIFFLNVDLLNANCASSRWRSLEWCVLK